LALFSFIYLPACPERALSERSESKGESRDWGVFVYGPGLLALREIEGLVPSERSEPRDWPFFLLYTCLLALREIEGLVPREP
jgi:hypothetical protein